MITTTPSTVLRPDDSAAKIGVLSDVAELMRIALTPRAQALIVRETADIPPELFERACLALCREREQCWNLLAAIREESARISADEQERACRDREAVYETKCVEEPIVTAEERRALMENILSNVRMATRPVTRPERARRAIEQITALRGAPE